MNPFLRNCLLALAALASLVAGFSLFQWAFRSPQQDAVAALMDFSLPDLSGKARWLSEWQGKTIVLNFWATWCAPCREEIPMLLEIQKRYGDRGIQIIGIAIDNQVAVTDYAKAMRINYPLLLAEEMGLSIMTRYGNTRGGLPYTVIIGRDGAVISRKLGAYKRGELESLLESLVKQELTAILTK